MKTDSLLEAINDIHESYIVEYGQLTEIREPKAVVLKKWISLAACVAIVVCAASFILTHFNRHQTDNPKDGELYLFENYNELCDILPNYHILRNLAVFESVNITCKGYQADDTQVSPNLPAGPFYGYERYSSLEVIVTYPDNINISIQCEVSVAMPLDDYVLARKPFGAVNKEVTEININGYDIWYAQTTVSADSVAGYTAVFADKGDYFTISSSVSDQEVFLEYVSNLLGDS